MKVGAGVLVPLGQPRSSFDSNYIRGKLYIRDMYMFQQISQEKSGGFRYQLENWEITGCDCRICPTVGRFTSMYKVSHSNYVQSL